MNRQSCRRLLSARAARPSAGVFGKRVIELGAGPGAVGLAAAALGASSVVLTDLKHLLPLISANVQRNRLGSVASVRPLDWHAPAGVAALRPPFDLVLASDVLYQRHALQPFVRTLRALCGPETQVLLSNEHRPALPFPRALFEDAGFLVAVLPWDSLHPDWRSPDIDVYSLRLA